jgi:hypothetical protein
MTCVLVAAVVLAFVYEVWAIVTKTKDAGGVGMTISEIVWHVSLKRPIVPFAFGVLMGHFFAQAAS